MTSRRAFAHELENAATGIADVSRLDLQIMLRRAALRIRNVDGLVLDADVDDAVQSLAEGIAITKKEFLRYIIREWLETNAYLPVHFIEEDSETDGNG